jgi:hypothetical protein
VLSGIAGGGCRISEDGFFVFIVLFMLSASLRRITAADLAGACNSGVQRAARDSPRSFEALAPNCFKSFRREVDLHTVWSGTSAGPNAYVSGMWHAHLNHRRAGAQNLERRRALLVDLPEATDTLPTGNGSPSCFRRPRGPGAD